jgi:serine/threonine-protein kinase/endoribonuclease IRE1
MAPCCLYNLFTVLFVLFVSTCIARSAQKRELVSSTERAGEEYHFIPPLGSTATQDQDALEMLNVVLLASVDGKLHALNRSTGHIIWSMSSSETSSVPSTFGPLVRTQHAAAAQFADPDDETQSEFYVIEPQSGDIFVMSNSTGPLQRLPLSMPQLVEMSPFSFPGDEDYKVFVGRKETSLLLLELETGRVKATISSECPWDSFEDPFEDLKDIEDELDLDELERIRLPKPEKPTEVFIGRTGMFSLFGKIAQY